MNTGKVRIYELSKELNLDNRDILAVCDKLNISVKSHSSTITEDEAARIRSAAEKYAHSPSSSRPSAPAPAKQSNSQAAVKQQIVEIRRHQPLAEPPKRPAVEAKSPTSPSKPAPAQANRPPMKLNAPGRFDADSEIDDLEIVEPEIDNSEIDNSQIVASEVEEAVENTPTPPEVEDMPALGTPPTLSAPPEDAAELVPPPPRPAAKASSGKGSVRADGQPAASAGTSTVSRPVLKRSKPDADQQIVSRDGDRSQPRVRSQQNGEVPSRGGQATKEAPRRGDSSAPPPARPKPLPELRRKPMRPSTPQGEDADETTKTAPGVGDVAGADALLGDTELRRPTPPRPPKKHKGWEEEEEDQEANKAGKAGAKVKRRAQPVIDEDEDLEAILSDEDLLEDEESEGEESSSPPVNLSLLRPPKQKRSQPGKPTAPATTQKPKRSNETKPFRRERRQEEVRERPEEVVLTGSMSVHELADIIAVPETDIIKTLFFKGIAANINQILDIPTMSMVAEEFDVLVTTAEAEAEAKKTTEMLDATDLDSLQRRPPVVTIMGHVDHGKTTLLDAIRKTKVAQGEAGGITQHIGAYHVDMGAEGETQQVVFLDTPGHEAFTAMRARGARVTDIAILVVAADDGVQPQTIEAISHAKAAEVPIIVAINKIDKEDASPDRVKQELTEYGLVPEEWGGDTIIVPVSAIKGENLDGLLEMILLVAEVEDLYANPDRLAKGTVIEAHLDKAKGPVATLLIQNGTLRVGDVLVAGSVLGKVRAMVDDRVERVEAAGPSFAVEVLGLSDVPAAGDEFEVYKEEKEARSVASSRTVQQRQSRLQQAMASRRVSLNSLSAQAQEGELKELNLILKADVQGSVEAILGSLQQLPQKEVQVRVLLAAPGEITETDVDLAAASNAVIIGFNTTFASGARHAADKLGVDVRDYNIIYKLLEDVQGAMEGLLEPELVEEPLGQAEVRAIFQIGRGIVAGCYIQSGKMIRNCRVRVLRNKQVIHEGNLDSLKRMKEDAKEVNAGYECGIGVDSFKDWNEGDIIESFRLVTKRRTLSM